MQSTCSTRRNRIKLESGRAALQRLRRIRNHRRAFFAFLYRGRSQVRAAAARAGNGRSARANSRAEGWRVRKDGSRFWAYVIIDPIRDSEGKLVGFAKVTRDLTERRAAEAELRRSQEQFRLLVQGVTDYAIYLLSPEGQVASWNAGAERIKGYTPEEIIGQHFSSLLHRRRPLRPDCRKPRSRPRGAKADSKKKACASARTARSSGRTSSSTRSATTQVR